MRERMIDQWVRLEELANLLAFLDRRRPVRRRSNGKPRRMPLDVWRPPKVIGPA